MGVHYGVSTHLSPRAYSFFLETSFYDTANIKHKQMVINDFLQN